jgi:hypothetical protein
VKVEYLCDFGSPNAYLVERIIAENEQRAGVQFAYSRCFWVAPSLVRIKESAIHATRD